MATGVFRALDVFRVAERRTMPHVATFVRPSLATGASDGVRRCCAGAGGFWGARGV